MREKEVQEKLAILNLSHGIFSLLLKITKLVETTWRRISRIRVFRISEKSK